jgi:hypothetical protein
MEWSTRRLKNAFSAEFFSMRWSRASWESGQVYKLLAGEINALAIDLRETVTVGFL